FALQALLVHDTRYGLAWTAGIVATMYALLWLLLRRPNAGALATLASAFGALAVIFATLTVPLAVDARWTSAVWAIEAAGVYWIGCREDRVFARAFAMVLQLATGVAFYFGGFEAGAVAFANRRFVGAVAIALSAFASVRFGDGRGDKLPATERALLQIFFAWACVWWLGGGLSEIADHLARGTAPHAMLTWVVASVAVAALLARLLKWPRLDGFSVVLLPALVLAIAYDVAHTRTTMTVFGWALFPAAWALHFAVVFLRETRAPEGSKERADVARWLSIAHTLGALVLLGH